MFIQLKPHNVSIYILNVALYRLENATHLLLYSTFIWTNVMFVQEQPPDVTLVGMYVYSKF